MFYTILLNKLVKIAFRNNEFFRAETFETTPDFHEETKVPTPSGKVYFR